MVAVVKDAGAAAGVDERAGVIAVNELVGVGTAVVAALGAPNIPVGAGVAVEADVAGMFAAVVVGAPKAIGAAAAVGLVPRENAENKKVQIIRTIS